MVRVAVAGALGRMGRVACAALSAQPDLALVGGVATSRVGTPLGPAVGVDGDAGLIYGDVTALCVGTAPDVLVDFTVYPVTVGIVRDAVTAGVAAVIGASGWTDEDRVALAAACERGGVGACIVPNFALGAVLMMRFAEQAAPYFPTVEIVELHHDQKRDAPSGTARLTAQRIAEASGTGDVPIHSVRLRGLVAHQEVLFGGVGELLTLRHDSFSRVSFAGGIVLAVRRVRSHRGLVVGLDSYLETPPAGAAP